MSTFSHPKGTCRLQGSNLDALQHQQLIDEARRRYQQYLEREKAAREARRERELQEAEAQFKEGVRNRFRIVNPSASEEEFQAYWQTVLDERSRQQAHEMLEKIRNDLSGGSESQEMSS